MRAYGRPKNFQGGQPAALAWKEHMCGKLEELEALGPFTAAGFFDIRYMLCMQNKS